MHPFVGVHAHATTRGVTGAVTRRVAWRPLQPLSDEATTSAYTVERLCAREQSQCQRRCYSSNTSSHPEDAQGPQRHKKSRKPRSAAGGQGRSSPQAPRVLPRLTPQTFRLFGPASNAETSSSTSPSDRLAHHQRGRAARVLRHLVNDKTSDLHDVFTAYTRLYELPGGMAALSPSDMRRIIMRLSKAPEAAIPPREAISRVLTLLDGAVAALESYPAESREYSPEVRDWQTLLSDDTVLNVLVSLISHTIRRPSQRELQDAFQVLTRADTRYGRSPTANLLSYNLLLNIVSRSVPHEASRQDYYYAGGDEATLYGEGYDDADVDANANANANAADYLQDLMHSDRAASQVKQSLAGATRMFSAVWAAIKQAGFAPDEFSWSARLAFESKRAAVEVMDDLEERLREGGGAENSTATTASQRQRQVILDARLATRGWNRITHTLRHTSRAQQLSLVHVNQALKEFSRLRLRVKRRLQREARTIDFADSPTLSVLMCGRTSSRLVQEVYETLRWNEVQMEMVSLRSKEEQSTATRSGWFPIFWSRFGTSPGESSVAAAATKPGVRSSSASSLTHGLSDQQRDEERRKLELLGTAIPRSLKADVYTYRALMLYYGATEADYGGAANIAKDYRQSRAVASAPLSLPILNTLIRPFAFHGVPADRGDGDGGGDEGVDGDGQWVLHDGISLESPLAQWNVVNLLPLLEETLQVRPGTNMRGVVDAQERRVFQRIADESDGGGGASDDDLMALLSSSSLQSPSTPPSLETGGTRAPRPDDIWMWLVALRRVTGDRYNGLVLDWYDRWRMKFGPREQGRAEDGDVEASEASEEQQDDHLESENRPASPPATSPLTAFFDQANTHLRRHEGLSMYADRDRLARKHPRGSRSDANHQGWTGWKETNRLRNLVAFLRQRKEMVG